MTKRERMNVTTVEGFYYNHNKQNATALHSTVSKMSQGYGDNKVHQSKNNNPACSSQGGSRRATVEHVEHSPRLNF